MHLYAPIVIDGLGSIQDTCPILPRWIAFYILLGLDWLNGLSSELQIEQDCAKRFSG